MFWGGVTIIFGGVTVSGIFLWPFVQWVRTGTTTSWFGVPEQIVVGGFFSGLVVVLVGAVVALVGLAHQRRAPVADPVNLSGYRHLSNQDRREMEGFYWRAIREQMYKPGGIDEKAAMHEAIEEWERLHGIFQSTRGGDEE